jgi:hypothetical protein
MLLDFFFDCGEQKELPEGYYDPQELLNNPDLLKQILENAGIPFAEPE